jgi:hypothetical protein
LRLLHNLCDFRWPELSQFAGEFLEIASAVGPGPREILARMQPSLAMPFPDWQPADEKGDEAQLLPPLRNGETAQLQDPKIENKETRPPPRYNEGTLIEAMQNLALC